MKRERLARPARLVLVPVLAVVALFAWAYASPIGSAPDDDYHLTSIWCASPSSGEFCEVPPGGEPGVRIVPEALTAIECFAYEPEQSAACQGEEFSWDPDVTDETTRSNAAGGYPPVFYAINGVLAGPDIQTSALLMRAFAVLLFVGFGTALWTLLPAFRRPVLVWGWLMSSVPLGVFVIASNNPSGWAVIGVGTSWLALLGYVESEHRGRTIALGGLFAVAAMMAAGARADAALFVGLGILAVAVLTFRRERRWMLRAILPAVVAVVALVFFLTARQSLSGVQGFSGSSTGSGAGGGSETVITGPALLAYNALNLPSLWAGMLTEGGLGWLDTQMPSLVSYAFVGVFLVLAFTGLTRMESRKAFVLVLVGAALVAIPLYVLQAGGDRVGQEVQPRYLLPLIVMFAGLLLLAPPGRPLSVTRLQGWLVGAALAGANFVALHMTLRRFVTGIDGAGFDLDSGAEWWWNLPFGPNVVWIVGSIAFAALVGLAVPLLTRPRTTPIEVAVNVTQPTSFS